MKKLILSIIIGVFMALSSYAEVPKDKPSLQDELPGVWWEHIPAICVDNQVLED